MPFEAVMGRRMGCNSLQELRIGLDFVAREMDDGIANGFVSCILESCSAGMSWPSMIPVVKPRDASSAEVLWTWSLRKAC